MPVIESVEVASYRLPMHGDLRWGAVSSLAVAEHSLITVHLSDGTAGYGEALSRPTIYGETPQSIVGAIDTLEARLMGLDISDQAAWSQALGTLANNHTAKGGLDMALWEARAVAAGSTLFDALPIQQERLKVSYILGISNAADMLAEAQRVYAQGVRVFKVKVGRDYQKDLHVIAELRQALPEAELYADSNETLSADSAPKILEAMREAGLLWVEEPLPVNQLRQRAALKAEGILPIIADDSCFTLAMLERELDFDTFDVLNIKTARTGYSQSLKMLELAQAAGKGIMIGSQAGSLISTRFAAVFAAQADIDYPSELSFFLKLAGDIAQPNPVLDRGYLNLADLRNVRLDPQAQLRYQHFLF